MSNNYCSTVPKETLIYNLQYHIVKCNTDEERIECVKELLNNFEAKENDGDEVME